MDKKYSALFTPWKVGNVEIKNRIVMCPMGGTSLFGWMEPNHFDKEAANLFAEIAENNVGLIIPGIAPLRDTIGGKWLYKGKGKFEKLKVFMDEIHKTGAKLFVQLTAGFGRSFAITNALVPILKSKVLSNMDLMKENFEQTIQNYIFSDISVDELASKCNRSLTSFKKEFRKHFYEPPHKWFIRQRLMHSRLLLISTNKSISEIGNECTFPNTSHFIKLFKKEYGMTPSHYRHRHMEGSSAETVNSTIEPPRTIHIGHQA